LFVNVYKLLTEQINVPIAMTTRILFHRRSKKQILNEWKSCTYLERYTIRHQLIRLYACIES